MPRGDGPLPIEPNFKFSSEIEQQEEVSVDLACKILIAEKELVVAICGGDEEMADVVIFNTTQTLLKKAKDADLLRNFCNSDTFRKVIYRRKKIDQFRGEEGFGRETLFDEEFVGIDDTNEQESIGRSMDMRKELTDYLADILSAIDDLDKEDRTRKKGKCGARTSKSTTKKRKQVVILLSQGLNGVEIAKKIGCVPNYISIIVKKLKEDLPQFADFWDSFSLGRDTSLKFEKELSRRMTEADKATLKMLQKELEFELDELNDEQKEILAILRAYTGEENGGNKIKKELEKLGCDNLPKRKIKVLRNKISRRAGRKINFRGLADKGKPKRTK